MLSVRSYARTSSQIIRCLLLVTGVMVSGCTISTKPAYPTYVPTPPDPVTQADLDDCQRAEARLKQLDCRRTDGSPRWLTPKGASFTDYCRAAIEDGRSPRPECIAQVADCLGVSKAQYSPEGMPCQS